MSKKQRTKDGEQTVVRAIYHLLQQLHVVNFYSDIYRQVDARSLGAIILNLNKISFPTVAHCVVIDMHK